MKRTKNINIKDCEDANSKQGDNLLKWNHPGGKFRRLGPGSCTEAELLAIVLGSGSRGKSANRIASEILDKYKNLAGMMGISLRDVMKIKGLKEVKATKLAAVFEIARRIVKHLEKV